MKASAVLLFLIFAVLHGNPAFAQTTGEVKTVTVPGGSSFDFAWVPAGTFEMGSGLSDPDHTASEWTLHKVAISKGFWLGKTEVTQDQWESVLKNNPSYFKNRADDPAVYSPLDDPTGDTQKYHSDRGYCPVENISPKDCDGFVAALSSKEIGIFRLPTEAEWEYACRAGSATAYYWGDAPDGEYFWYADNAYNKPQAVSQKKPNAWGLCDMGGNVSEICADWVEPASARADGVVDPKGPQKGEYRVVRGGNWAVRAEYSRSARRSGMAPADKDMYTGVRIIYEPVSNQVKEKIK